MYLKEAHIDAGARLFGRLELILVEHLSLTDYNDEKYIRYNQV